MTVITLSASAVWTASTMQVNQNFKQLHASFESTVAYSCKHMLRVAVDRIINFQMFVVVFSNAQ